MTDLRETIARALYARSSIENMEDTRYAADAILAIPEIAEALREWQPIETAPKDGSWVLVRLSNEEIFRAMYIENRKGWHVASDIGFVNAKHWMPLPPAPNNRGREAP